jgi:HAD superfamily phosphatase (TIGR01668 family)
MREQFFDQIDVRRLSDSLIILDIDGTLVADNTDAVSSAVREVLKRLAEHNSIYLCTNSRNRERNEAIAAQLNLRLLSHRYKKPNKRLLEELLPEHQNHTSMVVIGDKFLTDGLFALRIGAPFLKVKRLRGKDRWWIAFLYWIDDIIFSLFKPWVTSI